MYRDLVFCISLVSFVLCGVYAWGHQANHGGPFTNDQIEWMERQHARDGTKCCNEHDVYVGQVVEWRMHGGHYEVKIGGQWEAIPPNRLMEHLAHDPSPFLGEALLFYSTYSSGHRIWCFSPPPLF
jgi:hypothetical protein